MATPVTYHGLLTVHLCYDATAKHVRTLKYVTLMCCKPMLIYVADCRYLIKDPKSLMAQVMTTLFTPFTKTPQQGAATSIYLASSPDLDGITSKYYVDCKPTSTSRESYDVDVAKRLWQVSEELTAVKKSVTAAAAAL